MPRPAAARTKFEQKRDRILAAAQDILYRQGVRGMTLAGVAEQVGMNAPGISYYFKKKEDLATACFLAGIARMDHVFEEAAEQADEEARLRHVFAAFFARHRAVRLGEESQVAPLGEIRTLDEPHRSTVRKAFSAMVQRAHTLFDGPAFAAHSDKQRMALTQLLIEQVFWATGWLYDYDIEDYPRVLDRTCDLFLHGLLAPGASFTGQVDWPADVPRDGNVTREDFLIAATRLINQYGLGGASVDRICAELNVTKGSFYHHIETKEDLVVACFQRSLDRMRAAQLDIMARPGSAADRLDRLVCDLVALQHTQAGPFLRTNVLPVIGEQDRPRLTLFLQRTTRRLAALISDGARDGSLKPVDDYIAAQMLSVTLNAAAEARNWVRASEPADMPSLYAAPALLGVMPRG